MSTPLSERELIELNAYLDGELSAAERAAFEQRLDASPELQAELASLRQTKALLGMAEPVPLPRSFTLDPAVYGAPEPRSLWERLGLPPVAVFAPAAAALVAALVCVGVLVISQGPGRPLQVAMEERAVEEEPSMMQAPAEEEAAPAGEEAAEAEMAAPPAADEEAAEAEPGAFAAQEEAAEEPQVEMLEEEAMVEEAAPAEAADAAVAEEEEGEAAPAAEAPAEAEAIESAATPTSPPDVGTGGIVLTPLPAPTGTPAAAGAGGVVVTVAPSEADRAAEAGENIAGAAAPTEAPTAAVASPTQELVILTPTPTPSSAPPPRMTTVLVAAVAVLALIVVGLGAGLLIATRRR